MPKLKTKHLLKPEFWRESIEVPVVRSGGRLRFATGQRRQFTAVSEPVHPDRIAEGYCQLHIDGARRPQLVPMSREDTLLFLRGQKPMPPALWKLCADRGVVADWEEVRK